MKAILSVVVLIVVFQGRASAQVVVPVQKGWNIIGSVSNGAVGELLATEPPGIITSAFYGYTPAGGYASAESLTAGIGYWVKVSADGVVYFGTAPPVECGENTVTHGDVIYHTVQIGTQCWLKENLDVGAMVPGSGSQLDNGVIEKYCYNNFPTNCRWYGGLYRWDEAMQYVRTDGARGICPQGWHIPTLPEFQALSNHVYGFSNWLKALGQGSGPGTGTDTTGFSALLAGGSGLGIFAELGVATYFYSSTEYDAFNTGVVQMRYDTNNITLKPDGIKSVAMSVRCIQD